MPLHYYAEMDGEAWPLLVENGPDGLQVAPVDEQGEPGAPQAAGFSLVQAPGVYSLLLDGVSTEVYVEPDPDNPHTWLVSLGRWRFVIQVQTERERRLAKAAAQQTLHTGEITVKAPMPGLVRDVAVAVGADVVEGQRLVVLEAMKMENDIQAPRKGRIKAVYVRAGETVDGGRALVVLE
jgi:acetyl/propionyl-CoA carboxylase alpha subunit